MKSLTPVIQRDLLVVKTAIWGNEVVMKIFLPPLSPAGKTRLFVFAFCWVLASVALFAIPLLFPAPKNQTKEART